MSKSQTAAESIFIKALHLIVPVTLALALLCTDVWYLESGSMAPLYPTGSVIITSKLIKPHIGSVCAYRHNGIIIVHRIVSQDAQGFILKGDANNVTDPVSVPEETLEGVMLFGIRPVWKFLA